MKENKNIFPTKEGTYKRVISTKENHCNDCIFYKSHVCDLDLIKKHNQGSELNNLPSCVDDYHHYYKYIKIMNDDMVEKFEVVKNVYEVSYTLYLVDGKKKSFSMNIASKEFITIPDSILLHHSEGEFSSIILLEINSAKLLAEKVHFQN